MKVVEAKEMMRIEKQSYSEGASEEGFMNRAAKGIAEAIEKCVAKYHLHPNIVLLCGRGNNGGDAFAAGRLLKEAGEFHIKAYALAPLKESSPLCQLQSSRFPGEINYINTAEEIDFSGAGLIVDGILGTGFKGEVTGLYRAVIEKANGSKIPIFSIDIPSGINGTTGEIGGVAIEALETLFLGLPKTGCFFGDAWNHVGKISTFDFGLGEQYVNQSVADFYLLEEPFIRSLLPKIRRTRHKYEAGYVVGFGGSHGMPGAPLMTSLGALRSGAGIVRLLHPEGMSNELVSAPYELIREGHDGDPSKLQEALKRASSHFVGPGMGKSIEAKKFLEALLPKLEKPTVIDADALNLLASSTLPFPKETVLTPHHGEMKRLLSLDKELPLLEFLERCQKFANEKKVTLVLKGAPTFIFSPFEKPSIAPRGDPGMATAGTGDVLTGMIAAFLAAGKTTKEASFLGVYLHQMAGEEAALAKTSYSMVATDLIKALPKVFKRLS